MVDIETIKNEIVGKLLPLEPDKVILFGSYAYGDPRHDSDIDLLLLMDKPKENIEAKALFSLSDLMKKYKIGFDVLSESKEVVEKRIDPFYKIDIMERGRLLYGKQTICS